MRHKSYPWLDDLIMGAIGGAGLRRFQVSQIADAILRIPVVQENLTILSTHTDARLQFYETLPERIREGIRRPYRLIYSPGQRKAIARRRVYQSYLWFGDSFYQHFDGIGPEVADLVVHRLRQNRRHVQKHEELIMRACQQMRSRNCSGIEVDWTSIAAEYIAQYPDGLPV